MPAIEAPTETPIKRRAVLAWSLWDWGGSSFSAVASAVIFSVYITSEEFGTEAAVSAKLGTALLIAGIVVALFAPVVGLLSDAAGRRKTWLGINTGIVILSMVLMVFVAPSESYLMLGLVLLAVGTVAFEFAAVTYNAMLTQVSTSKNVGKVSGFGWGMGYIGGIVLLIVVLIGFVMPDVGWFGVTVDDGWSIRITMVVCAAWFAVFAIPLFLRDTRNWGRSRSPERRQRALDRVPRRGQKHRGLMAKLRGRSSTFCWPVPSFATASPGC